MNGELMGTRLPRWQGLTDSDFSESGSSLDSETFAERSEGSPGDASAVSVRDDLHLVDGESFSSQGNESVEDRVAIAWETFQQSRNDLFYMDRLLASSWKNLWDTRELYSKKVRRGDAGFLRSQILFIDKLFLFRDAWKVIVRAHCRGLKVDEQLCKWGTKFWSYRGKVIEHMRNANRKARDLEPIRAQNELKHLDKVADRALWALHWFDKRQKELLSGIRRYRGGFSQRE